MLRHSGYTLYLPHALEAGILLESYLGASKSIYNCEIILLTLYLY